MPTLSGFSKRIGCAIIPGGPIGEFRVPGNLGPGCTLLSVEHITDGAPPVSVERKAEFSIVAGKAETIINTTTVTTGGYLHVMWSSRD